MVKMLTYLRFMLFLLALALLGLSVYLYWRDLPPEMGSYTVEERTKVIEGAVAESTVATGFKVRNTGNVRIKIVGVEASCGPNGCCLKGKLVNHIVIPPGQSAEVPFEVLIGRAGEFSHEVHIYLDDHRWLRQELVGVKGVAKAKASGERQLDEMK